MAGPPRLLRSGVGFVPSNASELDDAGEPINATGHPSDEPRGAPGLLRPTAVKWRSNLAVRFKVVAKVKSATGAES